MQYAFAVALLVAGFTSQSKADVVTVTGGTGAPTATSWGVISSENTGTAVISGTVPRSGNGSVELRGDRTRFQLGIQYAPFLTNLGAASNVAGLSFDWRIAGDSVATLNADYTPALRLIVQDGSVRTELIWEGAYNGTYGKTARDTWYSSTFGDNFYQYNASTRGNTTVNGSQVNQSLAAWIGTYGPNAYVSTISVGAGSSAGAGYHAFADNVTLALVDGSSTTYNFETTATAVPEPASLALLLGGVGLAGLIRRRRSN